MSVYPKITMMFCLWMSLAGASAAMAKGPDFSIFEVRRQLALSNDEKTEKDFYVYAGSEEGVKAGFVYDVVRKVPLYDGYQNRTLGEITIKVAQLRVIYVDKNVSVARYHKDFSRLALPVLKENFILLGDILDLSSQAKSADAAPTPGPEGAPGTPAESVAQTETANVAATPAPDATQGVRLVINSVDITNSAYNP